MDNVSSLRCLQSILSEQGMPALIQNCKHTCKTHKYLGLSLWCHQQLRQLLLHLCEGCPNRCAPLLLRTNARSLQTRRLSPHGAPSPLSKPCMSPGPGEVKLGQWATGMGAGAVPLLRHGETRHKRSNTRTWCRGFQDQQQRIKTHKLLLLGEHRSSCNFSLYN